LGNSIIYYDGNVDNEDDDDKGVTIMTKKRNKEEADRVVIGLVKDWLDEFYRRIVLVFGTIVSSIVIFT